MFQKDKVSPDMIYKPLSSDARVKGMNDLWMLIEKFFEKSSLDISDVAFDDVLLLKILIRIDQRSDYFTYFHSEIRDGKVVVDEMSQNKQIALLCYWFIKYKPIRICDPEKNRLYYRGNKCTVNESFAAYIFISHIMQSGIPKVQKKYYNSQEYRDDLRYKFMHHDISKEAMIFALCSVVCCK